MGWIALGVLVIVAIWAIAIYNGLVTLRNRFKNAFSQIDVQLKRRYDLIPNLVESVKGYMAHERGTLEAVVKARGRAIRRRCRAFRRRKARSAGRWAACSRSSSSIRT